MLSTEKSKSLDCEIMRSSLLYGIIIVCCLIITTVHADKKWKVYETEDDKIRKKDEVINKKLEKLKNEKNQDTTDSSEESSEENHGKVEAISPRKEKSKRAVKNDDEDILSEEQSISGKDKSEMKNGEKSDQPKQRKFIGRIEHGKVMVLRRKEDSINNIKNNNNGEESEEDPKAKVCRKIKGGKKVDCDNDNDGDNEESNEEDSGAKSKKKVKYSIKFQHEKQKKKENNGNSRILRLHKNGKRYGGFDDEDNNSSEEDASPIKKRISYDDDD